MLLSAQRLTGPRPTEKRVGNGGRVSVHYMLSRAVQQFLRQSSQSFLISSTYVYMACLDFNPSAVPKDTTNMSSEITQTWVQILTLPHTSYIPWGTSLISSLSRGFLICKLSLLEIPTSVVRAGHDTCKSLKSAAGIYSVNKCLLTRFSMP